jgi:hypothetical protein
MNDNNNSTNISNNNISTDNIPSDNNISKCKNIMMKAPPPMKMFSIKDIIGGSAVMYVPWMIVLFITFIISII